MRRYRLATENLADVIYDVNTDLTGGCMMVDPQDMTRQKRIPGDTAFTDLLIPIFRRGRLIYDLPPLPKIKARAQEELQGFHAGIKRFVNPHQYPVGLEKSLYALKTDLILRSREVVVT